MASNSKEKKMIEKDQILILEDERIVAEDIKQILEKLDYSVIGIASTGEEALKIVEKKSPDIVLIDIVLKGEKDGIKTADIIKTKFEIPTVYVTAYSEEETLERAKKTQPHGYIVKPYNERELHSTIKMALHKHKMEEKLEKAKKRLEDAMDAGNLAWWEMELPSKKVQFSDRKEKMLGYSPNEFDHYSDFIDLIHPEDQERVIEAMKEHIRGREDVYEVEYRVKKKDGDYKWFKDVGRITEKGEKDYKKVTGVFIDIEDRKRIKEREDFLHSLLRHDLRNKLQVSLGYGQLLKEEGLNEKQQELVGKDWKAKQEAINLIEKIKKIREAYDEEIGVVKLEPILAECVEKYKNEALNKNMEIRLWECDFKVQGGDFLDEIFSNLIINSIKHSKGSEIRVQATESDDKITVTVEDDGIGVPDEKKKKVIEKGYSRGSGSGSGLGLYFVKEITKSYDGNLEIKDSELGGAEFNVELKKA